MNVPAEGASGLLTDLYQLTMIQGYLDHAMHETAVFELFVRTLPPTRNFLVAAGLEEVLDFVEQLRFAPDELAWLETQGFGAALIEFLRTFRFTGAIDAMPEGTIFFPGEPILRVTAPLAHGQLLETRVMNLLHFQSLVASKAVRLVLAAPGRQLVDFGLRRAHGAEAGLLAARACYLVGFAGTSNVLAGQRWNIPTFGTMAHAFIEAHDDELVAFEHFATSNPRAVSLLLDTYDTERAAAKVVALAPRLAARGISVASVRLDSGDLAQLARRVRAILDEAGLNGVRIVASGGLDETSLAELVRSGAPIDGYGVGTRVDASADAPYLDCAYKLVDYAGRPRRKKSSGKATWPGAKQVYRQQDASGQMTGDVIALAESRPEPGEPLLVPVVRGGVRCVSSCSLTEIRTRVAEQLARLPAAWKSLDPAPPFPVQISQPLVELTERMDRERARWARRD